MNRNRRITIFPMTARTISLLMVTVVFFIAVMTFIGWILGIPFLTGISPQWSAMRVVTAVCFLLSACALAYLRGNGSAARKSIVARAAGIAVGAAGLLTIASYLAELFSGHPWSLFRLPLLSLFLVAPLRMAIITAGLFSLSGCALFLLGDPGRRASNAAHAALIPVVMAAYLVIVGYLFNIKGFYEWMHLGTALTTGIAFLALCLAFFCDRPDSWFVVTLTGDEAGAVMARRLLPAIVILPILIGWFRIQGERMGLYRSEVGVAIVAVTYTFCFMTLVWLNARVINRTDRKRRRAVEELRKNEAAVRFKLESVLSPEGDIGNLEIGDIIDAAGIQRLMENFYELARIPMSIIDRKGALIVGVGWQEICTRFHRVHPETCRNCVESDMELSRDIPAGEFKLYKCKNHLWDMATPIFVGGKKLGLLFIGQFFFDDEAIDIGLFRSQAKRYGFDERAYLAALEKVPRISRHAIDHAKGFFLRFAGMISQSSYGNIKLARSIQSLRESQSMLVAAQKIAKLGSWELDLVTNTLVWSDEAFRIFEIDKEKSGADREVFLDRVHPDDRAMVNKAYADSLINKTPREIGYRLLFPDGRVKYIHEQCVTSFNDDGKAVLSVGSVQDITERQRIENTLRETRDYLDKLFQYANAPIIVWDPAMRITRFNAGFERLTGYRAQEVLARGLDLLFPEASREASITKIGNALKGEYWEWVEIPILCKNGEVRTVLWNSANMYAEDGTTLIATIAQGTDITERKQTEEALRETTEDLSRSNKDLEQFAYAASHDLQEPLRAVAGFMGILKKQYQDKLDKDAREYIDYAVEGAERMQRLIHDLLAYSRVGTRGKMLRPSSMQEALNAALYNLRLSIDESGAVITNGSLPVITADVSQMTQVFQNLIGNAIKFRGERKPEIAVSALCDNGRWIFGIRDNGIGIEKQYFDRIFLIFQKLHSREQYGGTGIGLAVVKKIIERHAGAVWVDSTPGAGSTFYFSIPDRGETNECALSATDSNTSG